MIFPFFHVSKNLTTTHLATKNGLNSNQPSRFVWGSMFGRFQPTKRGASGWSSRTVGKELAWKCPSTISGHQPLDGIGGRLGRWGGGWVRTACYQVNFIDRFQYVWGFHCSFFGGECLFSFFQKEYAYYLALFCALFCWAYIMRGDAKSLV